MTTIAYRDGVLAADKRTTSGGTFSGTMRKIHRRKSDGALCGGCGHVPLIQGWQEWFCAGERGKPPSLGDKDESAQIIVVRANGQVEFFTHLGRERVHDTFFAIGSGADLAFGAMEFGASARQAVAVAQRRDIHSGNGVSWVAL